MTDTYLKLEASISLTILIKSWRSMIPNEICGLLSELPQKMCYKKFRFWRILWLHRLRKTRSMYFLAKMAMRTFYYILVTKLTPVLSFRSWKWEKSLRNLSKSQAKCGMWASAKRTYSLSLAYFHKPMSYRIIIAFMQWEQKLANLCLTDSWNDP